jgi:hypothetical protein
MKVKDLPPGTKMLNIKVKVPDNIKCEIHEGYWQSQWGHFESKAGVWLTKHIPQGMLDDHRIYPVFLSDLKETLEWEVIQ